MLASLFVAIFQTFPVAVAQTNSHTHPAAIGEPVPSIIELGVVSASNYDVTVTLLETLRGEAAWERLQKVSSANPPPPDGREYLLARIRFTLEGRAVSDNDSFELDESPFQWVAYAEDFTQYEDTAATPPEPRLEGAVAAGETVEGWAVFVVDPDDAKPMLTFDPSSGGATGRGNILFFKLY